jgi:hypothetical protein
VSFALTLATTSVDGFDIFAAHPPLHFIALTARNLSSLRIASRFNHLRFNPLVANLFPLMAARLQFLMPEAKAGWHRMRGQANQLPENLGEFLA